MRAGYCLGCNESALLVTDLCQECEDIYGEPE